jgi:hypothetical protein
MSRFGRRVGVLVSLLVGLTVVAGCAESRTTTAASGPFAVQSTLPEQNGIRDDPRPTLYVSFSRPVLLSSLGPASLTLMSEFGEQIRGATNVRGLTPTLVLFNPESNLKPSTAYALTVHAAEVRGRDGESLAADFVLHFGTVDNSAPPTPTGGGGGSGGGSAPIGSVIYAGSCESLLGCANGNFGFDPAGGSVPTAFDGWSGQMGSAPSTRLHAGARVFLRIRDGSSAMPDGKVNRMLAAVIPSSGAEVPILGESSVAYMSGPRWAKNDSFVSYTRDVWTKGSKTISIFKAAVTWDSDGVPSFGAPIADFVYAPGQSAGPHDWAPNGKDLIHLETSGTNQVIVRIAGTEKVLDQAGNIVRAFWAGDGKHVVYVDIAARLIRIMEPSGANPRTLPMPPSGPSAISVSPDGKSIAVAANRTSGGGRGLFVMDIDSGQVSEVTSPSESIVRPFGWSSLQNVK